MFYKTICTLCGSDYEIQKCRLKNKKTDMCPSCAKSVANAKHSMTGTRLHNIWMNMTQRCRSKNSKHYGGRGISVCTEWSNNFISFYKWAMSNGYSDDLSIDRIDVNGNYEPSNCRWANQSDQNSNKRLKNYTGMRFGRLTVLSDAGFVINPDSNRRTRLLECLCECGNKIITRNAQLLSGYTKSCGCLKREILISRNQKNGTKQKNVEKLC